MFSYLSHSWPLIPINLALHFFRLVDTPAHASYPDFLAGHNTAYDYADDVVIEYRLTGEDVAFLVCLFVMLRPFLWSFFLRCFRFPFGLWRLATSWPYLDNDSRQANAPPSTSNSVLQSRAKGKQPGSPQPSELPQGESVAAVTGSPKSPIELERDAALQRVEDLERQLREKDELCGVCKGQGIQWEVGYHDLLTRANHVVRVFNDLADRCETYRRRSAHQTILATMLSALHHLDLDRWNQLSRDDQIALFAGVVENFVDDRNFQATVIRPHLFTDMRDATPQQQGSNEESQQPELGIDEEAGPSGLAVDQQSEM